MGRAEVEMVGETAAAVMEEEVTAVARGVAALVEAMAEVAMGAAKVEVMVVTLVGEMAVGSVPVCSTRSSHSRSLAQHAARLAMSNKSYRVYLHMSRLVHHKHCRSPHRSRQHVYAALSDLSNRCSCWLVTAHNGSLELNFRDCSRPRTSIRSAAQRGVRPVHHKTALTLPPHTSASHTPGYCMSRTLAVKKLETAGLCSETEISYNTVLKCLWVLHIHSTLPRRDLQRPAG